MTTLGRSPAAPVNVEPALRAGEPLGGHYVQGHVDGVGRIESVEAEGEGLRVVIEAPQDVLRYCVEKGSITVDGVALTVAELSTTPSRSRSSRTRSRRPRCPSSLPGREVNLEVDVLAKYVERLAQR